MAPDTALRPRSGGGPPCAAVHREGGTDAGAEGALWKIIDPSSSQDRRRRPQRAGRSAGGTRIAGSGIAQLIKTTIDLTY
jgi:hypothetical protein